ncbi:MAG: hypothetical protein IPM24_18775 [Bryobacterales bacterium]|nr:hypothetical protein [Bryobacterales bacterium]
MIAAAAAVFLFAPAVLPAQDARKIVARAAQAWEQSQERTADWVYVERAIDRRLDGGGHVRSVMDKTHEWRLIERTPHRRLIAQDGKPVPPDEVERQAAALEAERKARAGEPPDARRKRISAYEERQRRIVEAVREIPEAFDFVVVREEMVEGRPAWVIQGRPRPGYRPRSQRAAIFPHLRCTLWIDKAEGHAARLEAELFETYSVGWILVRIHDGAWVKYTQSRHSPGLWLPSRMEYQASARIGLFRMLRTHTEIGYRDWRPEGTTRTTSVEAAMSCRACFFSVNAASR